MSFVTKEHTKELERIKQGESTKSGALTLVAEDFDLALEPDVQTDKKLAKLLPCRECHRPLVVTTFFAPAKAICRVCKGEATDSGMATVGQPVPGETDPAKAVDLTACLINDHFAHALCPVHPDDEEHAMELKSVSHSDHYGPGELIATSKGLEYRQEAKGETAMHQCQKCNAVVTYSTTAVTQFRRINEPKQVNGRGASSWVDRLGAR